jgi:hypothetical protein
MELDVFDPRKQESVAASATDFEMLMPAERTKRQADLTAFDPRGRESVAASATDFGTLEGRAEDLELKRMPSVSVSAQKRTHDPLNQSPVSDVWKLALPNRMPSVVALASLPEPTVGLLA